MRLEYVEVEIMIMIVVIIVLDMYTLSSHCNGEQRLGYFRLS